MRSKVVLVLAIIFISAGFARTSHAVQVALNVGTSIPSPAADYNGGMLLGGEISSKFGPLIVGAFYEHTALKLESGTKNANHFYGGLARLSFSPAIGIFLDAKAGPTYCSDSDTKIGYGFGVGYDFSFIPGLTIAPRVGYRNLPREIGTTEQKLSTIDLSLLIALGF